ncbi:hypothetical protein QJS10_CPB14g01335 [Acorus calamus]|uniref:Uncharacterized protein n=1 Tax=Acorus calamus TaxID=4465 RepID=A0AAV9DCR7_ACOCL|nr:hypothetical protein QJS10_CPB14g01335 [Acorus calamus]
MVKARIAKNTIRMVQTPNGSLSSRPHDIIEVAVDFYSSLLNRQGLVEVPSIPASISLSSDEQQSPLNSSDQSHCAMLYTKPSPKSWLQGSNWFSLN